MKLYKSIRNFGKKALVSGTALTLGTLIFGASVLHAKEIKEPNIAPIVQTSEQTQTPNLEGTIKAKIPEKKALPEREITLDFANPLDNFEANANAWYSTNQLMGKGSDLAGIKLGWDKNIFGRIGQALVLTYGAFGTRYISHEIAHNYKSRWNGHSVLSFSFDEFTSLGFPAVEKNMYTHDLPIDDDIFQIAAGLNQSTFNSEMLFGRSFGNLTFDEGISFLVNKLEKSKYIVSGVDKNLSDQGCLDDIDEYLKLLNKKGINLSKSKLKMQSILADILSIYSLDSIRAAGLYVIKGERSVEPFTLSLFGKDFTPPLISHYLLPGGGFYNMIIFVNPKGKNPLELNLGTDVDFIGDGQVDSLRLGGKYHGLRLSEGKHAVTLGPFAYLNLNKSFDYKGFSIGTGAHLKLTDNVWLNAKVEYNKDDIIENIVKGEGKGLNTSFGITVRY